MGWHRGGGDGGEDGPKLSLICGFWGLVRLDGGWREGEEEEDGGDDDEGICVWVGEEEEGYRRVSGGDVEYGGVVMGDGRLNRFYR